MGWGWGAHQVRGLASATAAAAAGRPPQQQQQQQPQPPRRPADATGESVFCVPSLLSGEGDEDGGCGGGGGGRAAGPGRTASAVRAKSKLLKRLKRGSL